MSKIFKFENKDGKVKLNDLVTKWSADQIIQEMGKLFGSKAVDEGLNICGVTACAENAVDTLEIEINSPGGSVLDGHRIYQEIMRMRDRGVHVVATINSLAASMGSVIAMAADEIRMVKGGRLMIHEASQSVHGTAKDHLRAANLLESMTGEIAAIYAERSGQPLETIRGMMADETWLGAEEARELGFVDAVLDGGRVDTERDTKAEAPTDIMFETKNELKGQVDALTGQIESLTAEITTLTKAKEDADARVQEAADELLTVKTDTERLAEESAEKQVLLDAAEAKLAAAAEKESELTAAAEVTDLKVAEAAAAELAAAGHDPVEEIADDAITGPLTRETYEAQSAAITDPFARARFRLANKDRVKD